MIPVYNEEKILEKNVLNFMRFLDDNFDYKYKITIVDGLSNDKTEEIAKSLSKKYKKIDYIRTEVIGKGAQLKKASLSLDGDYFAFVDVDFPMKFDEILEILNLIIKNKADIIIGTRNKGNKKIDRPAMRKILSKTYNVIARILLNLPVSDTQCGVKAWNEKVKETWKFVKDEGWFFDTELLYHAARQKNKIDEVPVSYSDRRKESKILPYKDFIYFLKGLIRLRLKHYNKLQKC